MLASNIEKQTSVETLTSKELAVSKEEFNHIKQATLEEFQEEGLDAVDLSPVKFWSRVAANGKRYCNEELTDIEQLTQSKMLEMTTIAPMAYYAERQLAMMNHPSYGGEKNPDLVKRLKAIASRFNGCIAETAIQNPSITPHEINSHLTQLLSESLGVPDREVRPAVSTTIKGIQQEVAMGDLLSQVAETRYTSEEEDLAGADYIIKLTEQSEEGVKVDIKSSLKGVGNKGEPVEVKRGGIVMKSLFADEELDNTFHPTQKQIDKNTDKLDAILDHVYKITNSGKRLAKVKF